jgi:dienelactone hydrolase
MTARREDVSFTSGGDRIAAWFYPGEHGGAPRRPCVVVGHGFAGVKEARLDAFAERFAQAGLACLVFDYRHFGASGGQPRQLISVRRQQLDWRAAIAYARSLDRVDARRIALWGTSFGGGHVLEIASRDRRIRAAVLHMPLVDALATGREEGIVHTLKLVFAGVRDALGVLLRRPPYLVPVVGPPGTLAFMTAPEAEPGYFSIVRSAPLWRNRVPARAVFQMALFRPARRASRVRCPLLFIVGERDTITPAPITRRAAARVTHARVLSLPGGHFDAYLGDAFEQAVAAETAFLLEGLGDPAEGRELRVTAGDAAPIR